MYSLPTAPGSSDEGLEEQCSSKGRHGIVVWFVRNECGEEYNMRDTKDSCLPSRFYIWALVAGFKVGLWDVWEVRDGRCVAQAGNAVGKDCDECVKQDKVKTDSAKSPGQNQ